MYIGNETHPISNCSIEIIFDKVNYNSILSVDQNTLKPWGTRSLTLEVGKLIMHGTTPDVLAVHLSRTSNAGQNTLTLDSPVQWKAGDVIAIAATSRSPMGSDSRKRVEESEYRTIRSVSTDKLTITLTTGLSFTHKGAPLQVVNHANVSVGAEVSLLSRKITIHGGHLPTEAPQYNMGWQLNVGCSSTVRKGCGRGSGSMGFPMGGKRPGLMQIEGVLLRDVGQNGVRAAAVEVDGLKGSEEESFFRRNAIWRAFNTGISLRHTSQPLTVADNVFFNVQGDGCRVISRGNVITSNLVIGVATPQPTCKFSYDYQSNDCKPAGYRVAKTNYFYDNVVASSVGAGFITDGDLCESFAWAWIGNVAHSTRDGLLVMDYPAEADYNWQKDTYSCRMVGGVMTYYTSDMGTMVWYASGNVVVDNVVSVDNMIGIAAITMMACADDGTRQPTFTLTNSAFYGWFPHEGCRSDWFQCRHSKLDSMAWCETFHSRSPYIGNVGILETVFVTSEFAGRTSGESLFSWLEADSYSTQRAQAYLTNITFDNWDGATSCGRKYVAFYPNLFSNDTFHQHIFRNVMWGSNVKNGGEIYARTTYGPIDSVRGIPARYLDFDNSDFGAFWPDAPNHLWVVDVDGTFTKTGNRTSILSSQSITRQTTFDGMGGWRGLGNLNSLPSPRPNCERHNNWNAFSCGYNYMALIIESKASDALDRRSGPMVLCQGDGMVNEAGDPLCQGGVVDFLSGPVMKGKLHRGTLQRVARYRFIAENHGNYTLLFRGAPPTALRVTLADYEYLRLPLSQIGVTLNLRYFGENARSRVVVSVNGKRQPSVFGFGYPEEQRDVNLTWPKWSDPAGTHYHDKYVVQDFMRNVLYFTVRPSSRLDLVQESVININMEVSLDIDSFFNNKATFVAAMAAVLGISPSSLRFVKIVPGTTRRRGVTQITFEISTSDSSAPVNTDATLSRLEALAADPQQLSAKAGAEASNVQPKSTVVRDPFYDVQVPWGQAYLLLNITHDLNAFDRDVVQAAFAAFVVANARKTEQVNAGVANTALGNMYSYPDKVNRCTISFLLDVATHSTDAVELIDEAIRNGTKRILPSGYRILFTRYERNGAPRDEPPFELSGVAKFFIAFAVALVVAAVCMLVVWWLCWREKPVSDLDAPHKDEKKESKEEHQAWAAELQLQHSGKLDKEDDAVEKRASVV